jgi:hypothetical protein
MCRLDTLVLTYGVSYLVQRARAAEELAAFEAKQAAAKRAQVRPAGLAAPSVWTRCVQLVRGRRDVPI